MKALSMDLRERILQALEQGEGTQQAVADRFRVSLGMVKKLVRLRNKHGDIGPRYWVCGRKPKIQTHHREELRRLLAGKPDMTLTELRDAIGVDCTIQAIHHVLADMGLTYKKRASEPVSRTGPI